MRVAIQGSEGSFSEAAARWRWPEMTTVPCHEVSQVVAAVRDGTADAGCLPIENSLFGSVTATYDLLHEAFGDGTLHLADEILLPDIYFARDTQQDTQMISARDLVDRLRQRGKHVDYVPDFDRIVDTLVKNCHPGDLVLTMGPGNIWKVADALVQRL
jgi:prephenate dehydratase